MLRSHFFPDSFKCRILYGAFIKLRTQSKIRLDDTVKECAAGHLNLPRMEFKNEEKCFFIAAVPGSTLGIVLVT